MKSYSITYILLLSSLLFTGCIAFKDQDLAEDKLKENMLKQTPLKVSKTVVMELIKENEWHLVYDSELYGSGSHVKAQIKKYSNILFFLPMDTYAFALWKFDDKKNLVDLEINIITDAL